MQNPVVAGLLLVAVSGAIGSNILFRYASQTSGWNWLILFGIGIAIGFTVPLSITFALSHGNANIIFALMSGLSLAGLQIVAWLLFKEPLSNRQIVGIVIIVVGVVLVSLKTGPASSDFLSKDVVSPETEE